jgi:hypothetical protein
LLAKAMDCRDLQELLDGASRTRTGDLLGSDLNGIRCCCLASFAVLLSDGSSGARAFARLLTKRDSSATTFSTRPEGLDLAPLPARLVAYITTA